MRAMSITLDHVFASSQAQNEAKSLYGLAASKGVHEGPTAVVSGPSEFGRITKGDVLVTESTTEASTSSSVASAGSSPTTAACFRIGASSRRE